MQEHNLFKMHILEEALDQLYWIMSFVVQMMSYCLTVLIGHYSGTTVGTVMTLELGAKLMIDYRTSVLPLLVVCPVWE